MQSRTISAQNTHRCPNTSKCDNIATNCTSNFKSRKFHVTLSQRENHQHMLLSQIHYKCTIVIRNHNSNATKQINNSLVKFQI